MTQLRHAKSVLYVHFEQSIMSASHRLYRGDIFIIIDSKPQNNESWWKVLTKSGFRYIWFPDFEKSVVLE